MAGEAIVAVMQVVARADQLIIDLRRNAGGDPTTVALVCSYLFDEPTHLITISGRDGSRTFQSWTLPYVPGSRFGGVKPIWVLTSSSTFSGGEELAYDLQQHGRATIVGERTRGGAHPRTDPSGLRHELGGHRSGARCRGACRRGANRRRHMCS
jgi:C-terminal processing protease CtpA/Prc